MKQSESVNNSMPKKERKLFRSKKIASIPLIAVMAFLTLFTVGFAGFSVFRNIDDTSYPFVNDSRVIGKWQSVDFVANIEDFNPEQKSWKSDLFLTSLVFIKEGQMLSSTVNGNLAYTNTTWTKNMVLNEYEKTASKYLIKDMNGTAYMFLEWKSGDYTYRNQTPKFYVLKKTDSEDYSNYQVKPTREDTVDYPFVDDAKMKGKWESVDFVSKIDNFKPGQQRWLGDLFLKGLDFEEDGKLTFRVEAKTVSMPSITWTKGLVLNTVDKTASKCEIKDINGATYMFYEWKSGDYVYRGMTPSYYVLKKVE
ncbi:MAG: hypothetical protein N3B21_08400 [Clostridia bacterium]|nr:hypothetical protein [Clostridia bacterium]